MSEITSSYFDPQAQRKVSTMSISLSPQRASAMLVRISMPRRSFPDIHSENYTAIFRCVEMKIDLHPERMPVMIDDFL
jgi:hypothetical protein